MASALMLGLLVGFPIAAAPSPMFFLILRRTLARGWRSGLVSGLGIATGDAIYASIAAFGVVTVLNLLIGQRRWIGLVGGLAILLIGVRAIVVSAPPPRPSPGTGEGRATGAEGVKDYASTLGLTLSNPPTILSFLAVFAGLGVHVGSGWQPAVALVLGVTFGSALWWVLLTTLISLVRQRISPTVTRAISVTSGLALIIFGLLITLQAL